MNGRVRLDEQLGYYITAFDNYDNEMLVSWKNGEWTFDCMLSNTSAREDHIVFRGTLDECDEYIAEMYEKSAYPVATSIRRKSLRED